MTFTYKLHVLFMYIKYSMILLNCCFKVCWLCYSFLIFYDRNTHKSLDVEQTAVSLVKQKWKAADTVMQGWGTLLRYF